MQYAARILLSLFLVASVVGSAYPSGAKLRRDGVLNLYPFPRVGRSNPHTWQMPNDMDLEPGAPVKRQLYPFPRVGRSSLPLNLSPSRLQELLLSASAHEALMKRQLYPFPRVGRSQSVMQFPLGLEDLSLSAPEHDAPLKRQLYPFPRVGRSQLPMAQFPLELEEPLKASAHELVKRERESTDSTGMWFGPRLGRSFKSEDDEIAQYASEQ